MKKLTLLFLVLSCFFSCKKTEEAPIESICFFENPQPINDSELSKIPIKFIGIYADSNDVKLSFTENVILRISREKFRFHKTALDSLKKKFDVVNGKFVVKESKEIFEIKTIGDSIEFYKDDMDTIFKFSNSQKAKRIQGNLILSEKDSIFWTIKLISLKNNKLIIKKLYADDDLKRMDSITKVKSKLIDSTRNIITPSRSEFKKFLRLKNFGYNQEFKKITP